MDPAVLALCIPLFGIATGALAIFLNHRQKMAEIQAKMSGVETSVGSNRAVAAEVRAELQALREEVERLRETSTRFDLSFDAGLSRLEERISHVEGNSYGQSKVSREDRTVLTAQSR